MENANLALFHGKTTLLQPAPELGAIVAQGSEARSWLNGIVTCDLLPKKVGEGAFGLVATKVGKILAEVYIALLAEDRLVIGVRRGVLAAILDHFEKHLVMEDVELSDASADFSWSFLHGAVVTGYAAAISAAGGHLVPIDFTGEGACAVLADTASSEAVKQAILMYGGGDLRVATEEDWHAFRVERGVAWYGHDFDETSYAQEAALERFGVSFTKGCYLGQEAVFMLQVRGHVKKRLVQLLLEGETEITKGTPIELADGTLVGALTSVGPLHDGKRLALGHVKYKHAKPGETFVVAGLRATATNAIAAPKEG